MISHAYQIESPPLDSPDDGIGQLQVKKKG